MLFHTMMIIASSVILGPTVIHFFVTYRTDDEKESDIE